jgi:hypothetical protein
MTHSPFSSAITYTAIVYLFSFSFVFWLYLHPESLGIFPIDSPSCSLLARETAAGIRIKSGKMPRLSGWRWSQKTKEKLKR